MAKDHCEHCGAAMVEYRTSLNKGMAGSLRKMAQAGGHCVDIRNIGLTPVQYSCFQKLRRWGLIEQEHNEDGTGRGGIWSMTPLGWGFVREEQMVRKIVITYRNDVVDYEGPWVYISELTDGWWYRQDHIDNSRPRRREA